MKVLHLLGWYFPESIGGTEVYVAELARRQRALGCDTHVAAPDAAAQTTRDTRWEGSRVFRYPTLTAGRDVARYLETLRPDVVHVHSLVTGLGLEQVAAAREAATRVIFTAHLPSLGFICQRGTLQRWGSEICDGIADVSRCSACVLQHRGLGQRSATLLSAIGQAAGSAATLVPGRLGTGMRMPALISGNIDRQRRLLNLVDAFVVLNRRAMAIVLANGAPAHKVVLNLLGTSVVPRRAAGSAAARTMRPVRVGFIGRLHENKGVDVLLRAFAGLPLDLPISLDIVGPIGADDCASMEQTLRAAAAADSRITIRGGIGRDAVHAALRGLDVVCCPSVGFENGPTIALEAQAAGTPVIASGVGAIPEIVSDGVNGRILPPGDWRALAGTLQAVADDPTIIERWRAALPTPRTMDDVAADYAALYRTDEPVAALA